MDRSSRACLLKEFAARVSLARVADAKNAACFIVVLRGDLFMVPGRFDKGCADTVDLPVGVEIRDSYFIRCNTHNRSVSLVQFVNVECSVPGQDLDFQRPISES